MEDFYTTEEVAHFLGVTASRIRQLILERRINSQKLGRDHLIAKSELTLFVEQGRKKRGRPPKK